MKQLLEQMKQFPYSSVTYIEVEDLVGNVAHTVQKDYVFITLLDNNKLTIHWSATKKDSFFEGLQEVLNNIVTTHSVKSIFIEFIPEQFLNGMRDIGFSITSEWMDFWNEQLQPMVVEIPNGLTIRAIKEGEFEEAALITRACVGYSRGYFGETSEWLREWNETEHSVVLVAEKEESLVGVCCVNLYGFESVKGTILWLREVAVHPDYHSQKIGFYLMVAAINWGKENGAVRGFLSCDTDNKKAIQLYEKLGYKSKTKRGQINMEKIIKSEAK